MGQGVVLARGRAGGVGGGGGLHSGRLRLTPSWSGQPWGLLVNLAPPGG